MTMIAFDWDLAVELNSADKAIILNMIKVSIFYKETNKAYDPLRSKYFMDGVWWMQDSFESWQSRLPWLSMRTIQTYFAELFAKGYIQKKIIAIHGGGREAAFYRIPEKEPNSRKCKNCTADQNANSAPVKCKNCEFQENANSACSSSTINQTINPAINQAPAVPPSLPISKWLPDNEFAPIFEELTKLPICAKQFNEKKYTDELQALSKELQLENGDLLEHAKEWQKWHNTPGGRKPQKAWMNFEGWVKRSVRWKPKPKAMGGGAAKPSLQDTFENMVSGLKEHNRLKKLSEEQNG